MILLVVDEVDVLGVDAEEVGDEGALTVGLVVVSEEDGAAVGGGF